MNQTDGGAALIAFAARVPREAAPDSFVLVKSADIFLHVVERRMHVWGGHILMLDKDVGIRK